MSTLIVDEQRVRQWLPRAAARLRAAAVDLPQLEAALLAAFALGCERVALIADDPMVPAAVLNKLNLLLERRVSREPLAYILGEREFYSLVFKVTPEALIPRPETELLVEAALAAIDRRGGRARILDLGTGSGAIAVTLAHERPSLELVATDISPGALALAKINARRLGCEARIQFHLGDWWQALAADERFDLILSNPPYIPEAMIAELAPEVARFEPRLALAGGADGLAGYRLLAAGAHAHLLPEGQLMVEVGEGQAEAVAALFKVSGARETARWRDLAGHERVVVGRWA